MTLSLAFGDPPNCELEDDMPRDYHVTPNPHGGWDAKAADAKRASSHHGTQAEAEAAAKRYAANQGGEVRIHNRKGAIRDADTVWPARDPNPPKDQRR